DVADSKRTDSEELRMGRLLADRRLLVEDLLHRAGQARLSAALQDLEGGHRVARRGRRREQCWDSSVSPEGRMENPGLDDTGQVALADLQRHPPGAVVVALTASRRVTIAFVRLEHLDAAAERRDHDPALARGVEAPTASP